MIARLRGLVVLLVLVASGLCGAPSSAQQPAEKRLALVVGNGAYAAGPLPTAANDAGLVAQTLAQAGFDVTAVRDAGAESLRATFKDFVARMKAAGPQAAVFVYLAGYGVQFDGENFMVPVDAAIARDIDVPTAAVRLADFAHILEATPAHARVFAYDLARENPFAKTGLPLAGGLATIEPPDGSLYAVNAAPGTFAPADAAPYGVFARALAEAIQAPGLSMEAMFARVRLRVGELTNGAAVPWSDGKIDAGFTFYPAEAAAAPLELPAEVAAITTLPAPEAFSAAVGRDTLAAYEAFVAAFPSDRQTPRVRAMIAARRESLIWSESLRVNSSRAYWTYLRRYPRGPHFGDCRRHLAAIRAALEPPPRFDIYAYEGLPPPSPDEVALVQRPSLVFRDADWAPIPPPPSSFLPPRRAAFYDDLPPPPLPPAGALPLPVPVPLPFAWDRARDKAAFHAPGVVAQPFVPGYGRVTAESRRVPASGITVTVTGGKDVVVSKTTAVVEGGTRTIVQKGGDDAVISRTVTTRAGDSVTTVQSGPSGTVLSKTVSQGEPGGARSTVVTNGADRIVTDVQTNGSGVVTSRTSAASPASDLTSIDNRGSAVASPPSAAPTKAAAVATPRVPPPSAPTQAPPVPLAPPPSVAPSPTTPAASTVPKIMPPVSAAPPHAVPQVPAPAAQADEAKPPLPPSDIDPSKAPSGPIADPTPSASSKPEPRRAEQPKAEQPKSEQPKSELSKSELSKSELSKSGPLKPGAPTPEPPKPVPRPDVVKRKAAQHRAPAAGHSEPRKGGRAAMLREHRKARSR